MNPLSIIGGLSGAGQFLGGLFNARKQRDQSKWNTQATIKANKELAQYQYGQEMEQLRYMNEYNTPLNQRKRMEEANLNPALMYKGAPQNVQTHLPQYQRPEIEYKNKAMQMPTGNIAAGLGSYLNAKMNMAQVNLVKEQKQNLEQDSINKSAMTLGIISDSISKKQAAKVADKLAEYSVQAAEQGVEKTRSEILNVNASRKVIQAEANLKKQELELKQRGLTWNDPAWLRAAIQNWPQLKEILKEMDNNSQSEYWKSQALSDMKKAQRNSNKRKNKGISGNSY